MSEEIWKDIPDFEKYQASNTGKVRNKHTKQVLSPGLGTTTYYNVVLHRKSMLVHRCVALAFLPNPDNLPIVDHKDGNKLNNNVDNLRWVSSSTNCLNRGRNKTNKLKLKNIYERNKTNRGMVWVVDISKGDLKIEKSFRQSCHTLEEVIEYRNKMYKELGLKQFD